MTKTLEPTLDEIREEAAITKRILERVPADKLSWKPHPKSMSLGQLALHTAAIPGGLTKLLQLEEFDTLTPISIRHSPRTWKRSRPRTTKAFGRHRTVSRA